MNFEAGILTDAPGMLDAAEFLEEQLNQETLMSQYHQQVYHHVQ